MREIFLGKPWHWGVLAVVAVALWWAGGMKAHVIHFNSFIPLLAVSCLAIILLVLKTTKPGEQITREELETAGEQIEKSARENDSGAT